MAADGWTITKYDYHVKEVGQWMIIIETYFRSFMTASVYYKPKGEGYKHQEEKIFFAKDYDDPLHTARSWPEKFFAGAPK